MATSVILNTSDDFTPVLFMMTDGEGQQEQKAVEVLKDVSQKQSKALITFAIGLGQNYKRSSLINIAKAGNTKSQYIFFSKEPTALEDFIIKIGKENLSLVVECLKGEQLVKEF